MLLMSTHEERRLALEVAAETLCDPRSVAREIRALRSEDRHVRGLIGERIRAALASRGFDAARGASAS